MAPQQHVCLVCGYNMVGPCPDACPFCGAGRPHILTAAETSARFRVEPTRVNAAVTRLNSVPALGIEHAAYRIEAGERSYWIDCPSSFDRRLEPADVIAFTHKDFLGASNQYRRQFGAEVWIHRLDSGHPLCRGFDFDRTFEGDFADGPLAAWHLGGHTPGFTAYLFEDTLFACDLVFEDGEELRFNPYGPRAPTIQAGRLLKDHLAGRQVRTVCGWNYVTDYAGWRPRLDRLLGGGEARERSARRP